MRYIINKEVCYVLGFNGVFAVDRFSYQSWGDRILSEIVTIEKKVFDVLQKNNLDLMDRLDKAIEALKFYAKGEHLRLEDWQIEQILKDDDVFTESYVETGKRARECLAEIE